MKKITIWSIVVCLLFCLTGCGLSNSTAKKENASDLYSKDYDKIYDDLGLTVSYSNGICDFLDYWINQSGAGVKGGMNYYTICMTASKSEDFGESIDSLLMLADLYEHIGIDTSEKRSDESTYDFGVRTGAVEKAYDFCKKLQDERSYLSNVQETLETQMMDFKEKYGDSHADAFSSLKDYYLETISYAEFAIEPSGTAIEFSSTCDEYKRNIEKLASKAKIDK